MEEVLLVTHLILALFIIGLVLIQRSSGGGLGIGGGGGGFGDFATARSAASTLTRATTICALLFFCTSLSLGYVAKNKYSNEGAGLFTGATEKTNDNASPSNNITLSTEDLQKMMSEDPEKAQQMMKDSLEKIQGDVDASEAGAKENSEGTKELPEIPNE